jgi:[ribosomal protein S5]-alanine N-acetyltransferase
VIETKRLLIRKFSPNDYRDLFDYLSLPEIYHYEPGRPVSLEEARDLCAQRAQGADFLAVELRQAGKMIGHLYFHPVEPLKRMTWELGYIFNPAYHRKGYGSEAAAALVRHSFERPTVHRVMARCDPRNTASWKLLEKIGFRREGFFHNSGSVHADGNGTPIWTDVYEYSMLKEWIGNSK